ncbi:MAG: cyclic nucleotide-binding domain-containing protein [Nitrospira sp.]|nr:cyclic nucleotide-binding domain-containing protein [Nitrospira sp.]
MPSTPRVDLLRGAAFFRGLGEADLSAIAAKLTSHSFEKGAAIFRAGDPGDSLFLLARGKVAIRDGSRHRLFLLLCRLQLGVKTLCRMDQLALHRPTNRQFVLIKRTKHFRETS